MTRANFKIIVFVFHSFYYKEYIIGKIQKIKKEIDYEEDQLFVFL